MNISDESNSLSTEVNIEGEVFSTELKHVQTIKTGEEKIPKNPNFGRTIWDFFSERADRKARNQVNGYRFGFYIILIFALSYGSHYLMEDSIDGIRREVATIEDHTTNIWRDVNDIKQRLGAAPSSAGWFGKHSMDVVGCKGRGVETLQRAGATKINSEQPGTAWGTFHPNIYGFSCAGVVHCLEGGYVYIYAASQDADLASKYRDLIRNQFEEITKADRHSIPISNGDETVPKRKK